MILLCGVPTEPPMALAIAAAEEAGIAHQVFDQREHSHADLELTVEPDRGLRGRLVSQSWDLDLDQVSGVYVRLADEGALPDLAGLAEDAPLRLHAAGLHERLQAWLNTTPIRVASRPRAMLSNTSKTFQSAVIRRCGFGIPQTLVTNDPDAALEFVRACAEDGDEVIYKSTSGVRSIVQIFGPSDRPRLPRIRWCPTQFQRRVQGIDVRVHVVGPRAFATEIRSSATDYRYAGRQTGQDAELSICALPPEVERACISLAHDLELPFAGLDLRRTSTGDYVCFEVNLCPAYSYYETHTGAPIARALVDWLAGLDR